MTSLDGINGRSIQTLLRGENDSKQSDEFQASLKVEFDGSSATSIVTARRKVISSSLSSMFTAEALLHSADVSNRQSFISIEDLIRPRFSDSDFEPVYSMMWCLTASRDECLLFMGIRIRSLPPRKPMDPTDLGST